MEINIPKSMAQNQSSSKRGVGGPSYKDLLRENKKNSNKQYNFIPKSSRKGRGNKTKVSRKEEITQITKEINKRLKSN